MKPLHSSFHIPCKEIPLRIKDAQHLLKILQQHLNPSHPWALLRMERGFIILATHKIFMLSPQKLNLQGKRYLKTPLSTSKAGQILLNLSENQKDFNHKMNKLIHLLPMSKDEFQEYLLSQTQEFDLEKTRLILDQEYAKLCVNETMLKDLLSFLNVNTLEEQAKGFIHEALLSLGPDSYTPHHLAALLHHLLLDHHLCAPPPDLLEHGLCLLAHHPCTIVLGQLKDESVDGHHKNLVIRYNACLKKLCFYFAAGHAFIPVCPMQIMHAHLLLPVS